MAPISREGRPPPAVLRTGETSPGWTNACALAEDGRVWCWGEATGVGQPSSVPGTVFCHSYMSNLCTRTPVQVRTSFRFIDLDTASGSHCAISTARQWFCWPYTPAGATNTTPFVPQLVPDPA